MKKRLMFFALAAIGMASCNGGFKQLDSGISYKIADDKSGAPIKEGDFIAFNFVIKNDADSVMQSSYEKGMPTVQFMPPAKGKGNIMNVFANLSEGDSVVIKQNIDSLTKGRPRPKELKGKYIEYCVKIIKVIAKNGVTDQVFSDHYKDYIKSLSDAAKAKEPADIKKYIADNKLKVTTTASGLSYVITTPGSGPMAVNGDTVVVNYVGKFLNGKVFDTNIKSEAEKGKLPINPMNPFKPIRFALGAPGMIGGWSEAFLLFNKGTKASIIVPSSLGYGEQGNQIMGPYTPMYFDVELVDIVKPNPNAPKPAQAMMPGAQQAQPAEPKKK